MSIKKEIKKISKLINENGYIPVINEYKILFVINEKNGKIYKPKNELFIL